MLRWLFPNQELSPELTAMMIDAEGAKKFYISSLLSTNQVPEITGILLMALSEGAPAAEIKEVLIQVASGQLNPDAFSIINKPYVPELPVGIYPGQDLFFIHIHLLGLDTCAMHDIQNRFVSLFYSWSYCTVKLTWNTVNTIILINNSMGT